MDYEKIGLFYATKAERTSWVAEKIQKEFGEDKIEVVPIEQAWQNDFAAYDCFIVGASTWFDGELPTYWDELLPELRTMKLKVRRWLSSVWEIRYAIQRILQMESVCWQKSLKGMGYFGRFYFFRRLHFRTFKRLAWRAVVRVGCRFG